MSWLLYYHCVRDQVLHHIRHDKLLKPGDRVVVAVSGGADSVALLRVLLDLRSELGLVLSVAHFNHKLRGEASLVDEQFVTNLAAVHELPFFAGRADVREYAAANKLSLEHAARELRYTWLIDLARRERFDPIATAHTADDQAETVLMRFLRGAGTRGLAGIYPVLVRDDVSIVRPLLQTSRADIEEYLASIGQLWCEDRSNLDTRLTRNRIRHELLPLLERDYNPGIRRVLSESAELARDEEDYWSAAVESQFKARPAESMPFQFPGFGQLHPALQRRLLKRSFEEAGVPADFHHVETLRRAAAAGSARSGPAKRWVDGPLWPVARVNSSGAFTCQLYVSGRVVVPTLNAAIVCTLIDATTAAGADPGTLLAASLIGFRLTIRNWLPGDRFRPAHRGSEEKLKRLFAEKKIPAEQRALWPVALNQDNQIVWVRGFPVAHDFAWKPDDGQAVRIEVLPFEPPSGTSSPQPTSK